MAWGLAVDCAFKLDEQMLLRRVAGDSSGSSALLDVYFASLSGWHLLAAEIAVQEEIKWGRRNIKGGGVEEWKVMETRAVFVPQLIWG